MRSHKDSDAVAAALRESPPRLDEVAKARMERRLLEAVRAPAAAPPRTRAWVPAAGVLAAAAAVALGLAAWLSQAPSERVARMEVRTLGATRQSGTLDVGSSLTTGPDEVAELRIEDSVVRIEPSTTLRIEALAADRMAFGLERGAIRVEYHPRARGREGMTVRTARATVEVVGTVFSVRETGEATDVAVVEGRVRVVPHAVGPNAGEPRILGAGESIRVGATPHAAAAETRAELVAAADDPVNAEGAGGDERAREAAPHRVAVATTEAIADAPTERASPARVAPAQRLERARRALEDGNTEAAREALRAVLGAPDAPPSVRAQAFTLLGDLAERRGDLAGAARAYESAAGLGAGSMSHLAIYALARMQERRLRDPEAARASYRRYLEQSASGPLAGPSRAALCRLGEADACGAEAP
ncbi:MAG: FecR domain-containing protein [Sandaracinaceae bacterium]|nr:FecR domain-containing protein [Sandaracinaceae bacterium]